MGVNIITNNGIHATTMSLRNKIKSEDRAHHLTMVLYLSMPKKTGLIKANIPPSSLGTKKPCLSRQRYRKEIPSHGKFAASETGSSFAISIIGRSYYPPTGLSNIITISFHSRLFNGFTTGRFLIKYSTIDNSRFHVINRFLHISF